jgi:hypothetical protein
VGRGHGSNRTIRVWVSLYSSRLDARMLDATARGETLTAYRAHNGGAGLQAVYRRCIYLGATSTSVLAARAPGRGERRGPAGRPGHGPYNYI